MYNNVAFRQNNENDIKQLEVTYAVKSIEKYFADQRKEYKNIQYHNKIKIYLYKCYDTDIERKNKLKEKYTNKELIPFDENYILLYFKLKQIINYRNSFNHTLDSDKKILTHEHQINRHDELLQEGFEAWNKFMFNFEGKYFKDKSSTSSMLFQL